MGGEGDAESPQLHLRLSSPPAAHGEGEAVLGEVAEHCRKHGGTLLAVHRLAFNDRCSSQVPPIPLPPSPPPRALPRNPPPRRYRGSVCPLSRLVLARMCAKKGVLL